jgi:hypothetical protein
MHQPSQTLLASLAVVFTVLAPAAVLADQDVAASPADADDAAAGKKKKGQGQLVLKGRVFARAAFEDVTALGGDHRSLDLSVPSARLDVRYRPTGWLTLVVKIDATNKPPVKDAYAQARSKHLRVRAGQFKMPLSSITTDSSWSLPLARRGIIQDLIQSRMTLLSRRPGVLVGARAGGKLDPELSLSAFQGGAVDDKGNLALLSQQAVDAQNVVLRLGMTPKGQDVGLFAVRTTTLDSGQPRHHLAAGADALLDLAMGAHALRVWAEVIAGSANYVRMDATKYDAVFWEGRAIGAFRWGGQADGQRYLEPFVYLAVMDPDAKAGRDVIVEAFAGVNVGLWRRARLTLQLERGHAAAGVPYDLFFGGRALHDHTAVVMQTGAAF